MSPRQRAVEYRHECLAWEDGGGKGGFRQQVRTND